MGALGVALIAILALMTSCGDYVYDDSFVWGQSGTVVDPFDTTPPDPILDLWAMTGATHGTIDVSWTAVGDDGTVGTAASYVVKYSESPITDANFDSCTSFAQSWTPLSSGSMEYQTITDLVPERTFYVAIKAIDDGANPSTMSNLVSAVSAGFGNVALIGAGKNNSLVLKGDDTLWTWGENNCGQLSDNSTIDKYVPVSASNPTGIIQVTGGEAHSLALKNDGTVCVCGGGTMILTLTPVAGLTGVIMVSCGWNHRVALKSDGTVWAWGLNNWGQLGDGTTTGKDVPTQVPGVTGIVAISGGAAHTLALKSDGTLLAWGLNTNGRIGDGTTTQRNSPVSVSGISGVAQISGGALFSAAIKTDGTVWTWGGNDDGELGDGTYTERHTPVQVPGFTNVSAISTGYAHCIVMKDDGTVWTWGRNNYGQLGDGTFNTTNTPNQLTAFSNVSSVACGTGHCLVLDNDGTVWTWGYNALGQIGDGTTFDSNVPIQVK